MDTGYFQVTTQPKKWSNFSTANTGTAAKFSSEVSLHFKPMGEFYYKKHKSKTASDADFTESYATTPMGKEKSLDMWKREKIDDFVRKLGFLEAQTEEQSVKTFQQLNQVCIYYSYSIS